MLLNPPRPVDHPPLRGVNLGGWLVLEKWITPSLFEGYPAADEYELSLHGGSDVAARLKRHRDSFITRDDFVWLKSHGIDAVRLPIGYWIFGDEAPYHGAIEYVDQVFEWAAETGIYVLLDVHGAPGSQNGWDHSGRAGEIEWPQEANIIKTLEILKRLCDRYTKHPQLLGFELLNEPKWTMPVRTMTKYYEAAYKMIRELCGPYVWVVISDGFRPRRWKRKLRGADYKRVVVDTHQYQCFSARDKRRDVQNHLKRTSGHVACVLGRIRKYHPVMVGEWSITLDPQSLEGLDAAQQEAAKKAYGAAQLLTYSQSSAWFYWTYRTEDVDNTWNYRSCIEHGWL